MSAEEKLKLAAILLGVSKEELTQIIHVEQPCFVVWNESKTEGFVTKDRHLAYQVRKSAETNCYHFDGTPCDVAKAFIQEHGQDDCTMEKLISCSKLI